MNPPVIRARQLFSSSLPYHLNISHLNFSHLFPLSPRLFYLVPRYPLLPRPTPDWKRCVKGISDSPVFVFSLPAFPREESVFWFSYLVTLYLPTPGLAVFLARARVFLLSKSK